MDELRYQDHLASAVMKARGLIHDRLREAGRLDDVEDLLQVTYESAAGSFPNYAAELGSLQSWVNTIASRRCTDHLRQLTRQRALQERLEDHSTDRHKSAFSIVEDDFVTELFASLDARSELMKILKLASRMLANPTTYYRAVALIATYSDDVAVASRHMGVSPEALRDSRRELIRCSQVIRKATEALERGEPATVRTMLACLPSESEDGRWVSAVASAVVSRGGFAAIQPGDLQRVTGYSFHTCRQYLQETKWLLRVTHTILSGESDNKV